MEKLDKKQFLKVTVLLVISRMADLVTTYLITPDLELESNSFLKLLGWPGMIFFQIMLVNLVLFLEYKRLSNPEQTSFEGYPRGMKIIDFMHLHLFNTPRKKPYQMVLAVPTNLSVLIDVAGYVLSRALICAGILISLSSAATLLNENYKEFYVHHRLWNMAYVLTALFAVLFHYHFLYGKYRRYRRFMEKTDVNESESVITLRADSAHAEQSSVEA